LRWVNGRGNLQRGGHVDGAALLVLPCQQRVKQGLSLRAFGYGFHLFLEPQPNRTFKPHSAEFSGGPPMRSPSFFGKPEFDGFGFGTVGFTLLAICCLQFELYDFLVRLLGPGFLGELSLQV